MIEVTISEVQEINGSFQCISVTCRNKRSFKKATQAARDAFRSADLGGVPTLRVTTIKQNGKIMSLRT
jgi:hypothetical protein